MVPLSEAKTLAVSIVEPSRPTRLPLLSALNRFLTDPIECSRSLPACDNAAMDGYALKSAETRGANRDRPARFEVVETIFAGRLPTRFIGSGEAARIFTGGAIPTGADTVIRQEATRSNGAQIEVFAQSPLGHNIRRRGEEIQLGAPLFFAGQRVDPYVLGMLASMGQAQITVRPKPRVAILTVGDELVAPGQNAAMHQVFDSNSTLLAAMAMEAGAEVVGVTRVVDEDRAIEQALEKKIETAEIIITSGGASVGEKDRVKRVVAAMGGPLAVDGVAIKPGKPLGVGKVAGRPIAILPGNPGASAVAFDQIARAMLFKRQGVEELRRRIYVRMPFARKKQPQLTYYLSASLDPDPHGGLPAAKVRPSSAGQIFQNVGAEGWVILPNGRDLYNLDEEVEMELFFGSTFQSVLDTGG